MFRGTQTVKLDSKGRLVIPSRYRESLEAEKCCMVVTGHPRGYLLLMRLYTYEEMERRVNDLPETSEEAMYYKQTLMGKADDTISFDSAGRISLSPDLRQHANLETEVAVVGMREHLRLWSKDELDKIAAKSWKHSDGLMGNVPNGWEGFRI